MFENLKEKVATKIVETATNIVNEQTARKNREDEIKRAVEKNKTALSEIIAQSRNVKAEKILLAQTQIDALALTLAIEEADAKQTLVDAEQKRNDAEKALRNVEVKFCTAKAELAKELTTDTQK